MTFRTPVVGPVLVPVKLTSLQRLIVTVQGLSGGLQAHTELKKPKRNVSYGDHDTMPDATGRHRAVYERVAPQDYIIVVSAPGMKTVTQMVTVVPGIEQQVTITLTPL